MKRWRVVIEAFITTSDEYDEQMLQADCIIGKLVTDTYTDYEALVLKDEGWELTEYGEVTIEEVKNEETGA